jgi:MoaA/NifB/PqqE/SkfB family radical SAM enzyme
MTQHLPTRRTHGAALAALKSANSLLLREDVAARRTAYRGLPEVVTLNHTDICNLRCIMCPRNLAQGTNRLDADALLHVTNELLPTARKLVLTTSGAEPLAVDYELLMQQALRNEVRVDAVTNGTLLTRELYRESRSTLDHLNISLDSHRREIYERIRLGAKYDRVFGNLRAVCETRQAEPDGVLLSVSAIVMASNVPHLADFVRFAAALGTVDGVVFQRLRHEEKPIPAEEPSSAWTEQQIQQSFAEARRAAIEGGINLFLSEFGQPPTLARPLRDKVPMTIEGQGLCWFLAQNFTVMYTGEVFPCCIPTDYSLGNVLYQDPVDIWNGKPMQDLRAAHLSRRGTTFCSGCLHAPHLPAKKSGRLHEQVKAARVAISETMIKARERFHARFTPRIFAPRLPAMLEREGHFVDRTALAKVTRVPTIGMIAATDPRDGSIWSLEGDALVHRPTVDHAPRIVTRVETTGTPSCLHAADDAVLFGFEDGKLRRFDSSGTATVLELSDPRSFVRTAAISRSAAEVVVGEYGVFPGARCAHLYRSTDAGRSFRHTGQLRAARHVHVVQTLHDGSLAITTGDIADERRLYVARNGGQPRLVRRGWSGYTAIATTDRAVHCGTDLPAGNGLVAFRAGLSHTPEFRRLPSEHDCQIRQILSLPRGHLLALCAADNEPSARDGRRGAIFCSVDDGRSFSVVHRFAEDWHDAPDSMVLLQVDPVVVLLAAPSVSTVLELPLGSDPLPRAMLA